MDVITARYSLLFEEANTKVFADESCDTKRKATVW